MGSVSPAPKTLAGAAVDVTPFGRSSFVFAMRDNRGLVAEYTMQDRMFRNADELGPLGARESGVGARHRRATAATGDRADAVGIVRRVFVRRTLGHQG